MKKTIIMLLAIGMMAIALPTQSEAGIFSRNKTKTGQQVARKNAKNSVKAGKKMMKQLAKASRNKSKR